MSVEQSILKANSVLSKINLIIDEYSVQNKIKHKMMAGLLSLCREHYSAIIELHYGSASSLARPLYEAHIRLSWLSICGTEDDALAINNGSIKFKGITALSKDIDKMLEGDSFGSTLKQNEDALHDYTHGGIRQIAHRFNDEGYIEASFHNDELHDLLKVTGMNLAMACMGFFAGVNDVEKAHEAKAFVLSYTLFD